MRRTIQEHIGMMERVGRNEPCPCGSGKKYKKCCYGKNFDFLEDEDGEVYRSVPITEEMSDMLSAQIDRFREEHGREPEPDDLLFFDGPLQEQAEHEMVQAMQETGINPAQIHAFVETGVILTEDNLDKIPNADIDRFHREVEKYVEEHGRGLPTLPWTRTEWSGMEMQELVDSDKMRDFWLKLNEDLFSDEELLAYYETMLMTLQAVGEEEDLSSRDRQWLEQKREEFDLNRETLVGVLQAPLVTPAEVFGGMREAFEFALFTQQYGEIALDELDLNDDEEICGLLDQVGTGAIALLVVAINQQFGLIEESGESLFE